MSIPQKAKGTDLTSLELVSRHEIGSVLTYDPLSPVVMPFSMLV